MYKVSKRVMKNRFVMLLIDSENCNIDAKCEEDEAVIEDVETSYFIVKRDKREDVVNFDRETTSAHDIGFLDVVVDVTNEVTKQMILLTLSTTK